MLYTEDCAINLKEIRRKRPSSSKPLLPISRIFGIHGRVRWIKLVSAILPKELSPRMKCTTAWNLVYRTSPLLPKKVSHQRLLTHSSELTNVVLTGLHIGIAIRPTPLQAGKGKQVSSVYLVSSEP